MMVTLSAAVDTAMMKNATMRVSMTMTDIMTNTTMAAKPAKKSPSRRLHELLPMTSCTCCVT